MNRKKEKEAVSIKFWSIQENFKAQIGKVNHKKAEQK